ncbi:MAG: glyceraldehyde-3-phosphate dehydrogenase [Candidatus Parcubacteria bacterium]|nr:MAG: glyceraldehyde-3-phosphate dehydrogenase [Candidatus Parcubacteria bacterium]
MTARVAINGFGRIGRAFLRAAWRRPELHIIAINDLGDPENLAYLLKYDTVYGRFSEPVRVEREGSAAVLVIGEETRIAMLNERDPTKLPWREMDIDIVVEATGIFDSYEKARVHLEAGAERVVITAPVKDEPPAGVRGATVLVGVNEEALATCDISSNASCTTNAASPVVQILHEAIGIERAMLSTVHAYTATQRIVDGPDPKDFRRGRAGAQNIIPTSTGAAVATTKAIVELAGKFDGVALRVPVPAGSIADITFVAKRPTTAEEINSMLRAAAATERWRRVFAVTEDPIVSSDIISQPYASIADLRMTRVVDGTLGKVMAWYDNEMGYVHALVEHTVSAAKYVG